MSRQRYLVTYDVGDDKRRTAVFTTLKNFGDRLQYSVFRCDLDARALVALRASLHAIVHHGEDQVLMISLGPASGGAGARIEAIGRAYVPDGPVRIV